MATIKHPGLQLVDVDLHLGRIEALAEPTGSGRREVTDHQDRP